MKTTIALLSLISVTFGCRADEPACEACGHIITKRGGSIVKVLDGLNINPDHRERYEWYCTNDKPKGDTVRIFGSEREWYNSDPEPKKTITETAYTCAECQHLFKPGTGKDVSTANFDSAHISNGVVRFCKPCSPAYDRIVTNAYRTDIIFVKHVPPVEEKWVKVNKDGSDLIGPSIQFHSYTNIIWHNR